MTFDEKIAELRGLLPAYRCPALDRFDAAVATRDENAIAEMLALYRRFKEQDENEARRNGIARSRRISRGHGE